MKLGDVVRNKRNGTYGTVEYSTFGFSIHTWDTMGDGQNIMGKTLGAPAADVEKHWEVCELPEGYCIHEHGGVQKNT